MNKKLAIIADDLTGANDTGVQFSKKGLSTGVITDLDRIEEALKDLDVLVVDTESRFDIKEKAYDKVFKAAKILDKNNIDYIYKKLDSTLRGNIGSEIEAVMEASKAEIAIVVPALPQNGRTTIGGMHMVNNIPLEKTEIAQDPITPVQHSYIPDIINMQTNKKVGLISLKEVLKGEAEIVKEIEALTKAGVAIVVIDGLNSGDLINIAKAIKTINKKIIMVGSAGLAEYIPQAFELTKSKEKTKGSVVIIAGSVSDVTRSQVNHVSENPDIQIIDIDVSKIFIDKGREKYRVMNLVKDSIQSQKDIIIRSAKDREQVDYARYAGEKLGFDRYKVSEGIAQFLGEITKEICEHFELQGLMLTGGDIAIKAAKLMGVSGTIIQDEILPGIPYGYFISEKFGNIPIVTKAGGFGQEDTIIKVVEFLKRR